ncbi:hypothetical protein EDC23_2735 [Thiohalophilus thiocyanatoxydans]|uniref:Uncharacterized protein n=1 Tax=Thiohalophilus thiocyanatoxydans TaxID=381308 RepID=A0A4R8IP29_9GAMM|nr:hypothetical protein EDC23_2735 [Thiohalophilus thiocyanatoxydans]
MVVLAPNVNARAKFPLLRIQRTGAWGKMRGRPGRTAAGAGW